MGTGKPGGGHTGQGGSSSCAKTGLVVMLKRSMVNIKNLFFI
ncbi:hypothetical protein [Zunongwangia profunda]|jgi:hypothetical protein|nr:hypothetical protein [Zunongwangia profunda]|tara:strand:+ start:123 stop:248 length:126 start_codon:yes stop_codon:yes gene_type:complete